MNRRLSQLLAKITLPIVIGILLAVGIFWPLLHQFSSASTSLSDGSLIAWLIHHTSQSLAGKAELFNPPFIYPFSQTLTYSDPFVSSGLIALILSLVTPSLNLIEQLNMQLLLGTLGYFCALYWLLRILGVRTLPSLLLATIGTCIPLKFAFVVHLHTYLLVGIPLGLCFLMLYLRQQRWLYLIGWAAAYLFQLFNAPLTAYFFITTTLIYLLCQKKLWPQLIRDKKLLAITGMLLITSVWFYFPYWQQAQQFESTRSLRDAAHFSYSIERLLQWDVLTLTALTCLLFFTSQHKALIIKKVLPWLLLTLIGLIFMLGPVVKIDGATLKVFDYPIPLPYFLVYYLVPGLAAFRSVTRWSVVASLGWVVLIGILIQSSSLKTVVKQSFLVCLAVASIIFARQYLPLFSLPATVPKIYEVVASQPEKVMAIFPQYVWAMVPYHELEQVRLLYQPASGKTYYNGASGFQPPVRTAEIMTHFRSFPNPESLGILQKNGVGLILVEYDEFQRMFTDNYTYEGITAPDPADIKRQLEQSDQVSLIECLENTCLYRLREPTNGR